MHPVERFQTPVLLVAVALGVAAGQLSGVAPVAEAAILPALLATLFVTFLGVPFGELRAALRRRRFLGASLAFNFVWTPLLAVGLGAVFLRGQPDLWIGLLMLLVTPCTDWYLAFTDLADGDVPLATALLPYNLLLQVLLLPVYLFLFAGAVVDVQLGPLVEAVAFVLVGPILAATLARRIAVRIRGPTWFQRTAARASPWQVVLLASAVGAMFASQGTLLLAEPWVLALLALPILAFFAINYVAGGLVSRLAGFSYPERACFTCTTLARNSPTALAIAVAAFPDRPLVALALVVGPLLELPLLSLVTRLLRASRRGADHPVP